MDKITAIIERTSDGTYAVYCKDQIFSGAGSSIEEAKKDMMAQMAFYKDTALKEGTANITIKVGNAKFYNLKFIVSALKKLKK